MSTSHSNLSDGTIHFVLDWDGTITKKDTLDAIVNIAAKAKPDFPTQERWEAVVDAYLSDYNSTLDKLIPNGVLPTTIQEEKKLLKDLKIVEQRSLDRVFESKIFRDLNLTNDDALFQGAERAVESGEVSLRPGAKELMRSMAQSKSSILHILSVNWSRTFIATCLSHAGAGIPSGLIFANELVGLEEGKPTTGQISPDGDLKIISSDDKLRYLGMMRDAHGVLTRYGTGMSDVHDSRSLRPVVYVGDSWTDIECLLAADLGICIRDEPMGSSQKKLAEALERLGVGCPHLKDLTEVGQEQVVWARDFVEIQEWVSSRGS